MTLFRFLAFVLAITFSTAALALDTDNDCVGNACEDALTIPNPDQIDSGGDGIGDVAENCEWFETTINLLSKEMVLVGPLISPQPSRETALPFRSRAFMTWYL
jgi:hypothetical protein